MESGVQESDVEIGKRTSSLPNSLTMVTPLSKFVTAILFITLPFVGFYLGVKYNQVTNSSSLVIQPTESINSNTSSTSVVPTSSTVNNTPTDSVDSSNCIADLGVNPYLGVKYGNNYSKKSGWCNVIVPYSKEKGYSLDYPENWKVSVVGVTAQNLVFNAKDEAPQNRDLFIEKLATNLELKDTYKESFQFEMSEVPIVKPEEVVESKEIKKIGDKECLVMVTTVNSKTIRRYFTILKQTNYNDLFVFEIEKESSDFNSQSNKEIILNVEEMIKSLKLF